MTEQRKHPEVEKHGPQQPGRQEGERKRTDEEERTGGGTSGAPRREGEKQFEKTP